jgi:hypothetical protein
MLVSFLAVVLAALFAPQYRLRKVGGHWEGFDMLNRVEASVGSPGTVTSPRAIHTF